MSSPKYSTYLINLDRTPDRLSIMKNELAKCEMEFVRVRAVDSRNLDTSKFIIKNHYKREISLGEIGCYMSHVKVMKQFLNSDNEFAVILEDDIKLQNDFKQIVEKVMDGYTLLPEKHQWDILKLYNGKRRHIKITDIDSKHIIGACGKSVPVGTVAAVFTRKAAEKFLSVSGREVTTIKRPIDSELQNAWEYDLRIYNVLPSIVSLIPVETEIHVHGRPKTIRRKQIKEEVLRFIPKHLYLIKHHGIKAYYNSFIVKKNPKIL